jgi:hypothetical protein
LPDGQISKCPVQPFAQKYSCIRLTRLESISLTILSHSEGRFANVTDVGRDAMDAAARETGDANADGEVVWS